MNTHSQPDRLLERLRSDPAQLDVDTLLARYLSGGGKGERDEFLGWLHTNRHIGDDLFRRLHASDEISVGKLVVRADRTLLLQQPRQTMVLPSGTATVIAGPGLATVIAPDELPEGSQSGRPRVGLLDPGGAQPAAFLDAEPGVARQRYALLGCLGKGAMGEVHLARDEDLLRKVAFKRMVPEVAKSRALAARFFSEIQVTAQLDHPNIIPIYGLEASGDSIGYSMKLIQGRTFTSLLDDGRAAAAQRGGKSERERLATRLDVLLKVCDAMSYAHAKGVLHRDLKPDNVMVGRYNEVYVMDWGICRLMGSDDPDADVIEGLAAPASTADAAASKRTQLGTILGTPAYMSPEQAAGRNADLDGRSDLYALGLILQEVVTLRAPIAGESLEDVLANACAGRRLALTPVAPGAAIPRELAAIIDKATRRNPEQRYAGVAELADDLRRFQRGEGVRARPDNSVQRAARFLGHHRMATLSAIAGLVILAAAAAILQLAHERRGLERAKLHEERLQALVTAVEQQSHLVDNHFHEQEALLAALAAHAEEIVGSRAPAPMGQPVYLSGDYEVPGRGPADLGPSRYYKNPVSLAATVVELAPGVDPRAVGVDVALAPRLRPALEEAIVGDLQDGAGDPSAARARVRDEGAPFLRAWVSLASGVHVSYPGMGGWPADYDGRLRPKYLLAAHHTGIRWGNAYPDRLGHGLLLPAAVSIYDAGGAFLGVVGADTTFTFLRERLLGLPGHPEVEATYLVDDRGRVVVHGGRSDLDAIAALGNGAPIGEDASIELEPLAFPAVVSEIQAQHSGAVDTAGKLVFFERLSSLGWYYVVVAEPSGLVAAR